MLAPLVDPDRLEQLVEPLAVDLAAGDLERQEDVLLGGQRRQQVEELEDEADALSPEQRQLLVVQLGDLDLVEDDAPELGRSRPARMCIRVDFPSPTAP